jgi:uncharacterized protein YabE (DUF348 family)
MNSLIQKTKTPYGAIIAACCLFILALGVIMAARTYAVSPGVATGKRLITIHDNGQDKGVLTRATTMRQALAEAKINLDVNDTVEPGLDEELVGNNYEANIYRARPVTIVDGAIRTKVMSPYRTASQIVKQAGMVLQDEDITKIDANTNLIADGSGVRLTIDRATPVTLVLYGKQTQVYTQATTVNEMLKEKKVTLAKDDTLSVAQSTPITSGVIVELWRNGKQTQTVEEAVPFDTEKVQDSARDVSFREVKTPGVTGKKTVTYEISMKNGQEVGRTIIQSVETKKPEKQVEIVGAKSGSGLTKAKGVISHTDSKGVVHRETYYDLPMSRVMSACGGTYSVRSDGVKVDQDGYILIAANLSRYPRCTLVETSLGTGKVYDTGGFVTAYPDGFDLATDWSNNDGI